MLLKEYFTLRCGGNRQSLSLTDIEKSLFRIVDTSSGWFKRYGEVDIPDPVIAKACKKIIEQERSTLKTRERLQKILNSLTLSPEEYNASSFGDTYLYIMQNELGMYKIGISKNPRERRNSLSTGSGLEVTLVAYYFGVERALDVERRILFKLKEHLKLGEWFKANTVTVAMMEALMPSNYRKMEIK